MLQYELKDLKNQKKRNSRYKQIEDYIKEARMLFSEFKITDEYKELKKIHSIRRSYIKELKIVPSKFKETETYKKFKEIFPAKKEIKDWFIHSLEALSDSSIYPNHNALDSLLTIVPEMINTTVEAESILKDPDEKKIMEKTISFLGRYLSKIIEANKIYQDLKKGFY